ncbi:MAG: polysaccharide deacetylase family protein [Acaryochloridaceae cyanobacterium SU_2_1]|nr:polysaccharide deacetylase family protein [Acaryochloridaceae cyanobacterium SU_2_1]
MLNRYLRLLIQYRLLWGTLAAGLLLVGVAIAWMQPRWLFNILSPAICPGALYYVETAQPLVALTIDDGPDDQRTGKTNTTQKILDILAQHQAKATFFLISNRITPQNQGLIAEMIRQGHELGNHLMADEPSINLPLPKFEAALKTAEQKILAAAQVPSGYSLQWLRPGSGRCNPAMSNIAQQQGYRMALGSLWPYDTSLPSSSYAVQQILANLRPGSVLVLHDYGPHGDWGDRTVVTLAQVLPKLKERGYTVVTLTELVQSAAAPVK